MKRGGMRRAFGIACTLELGTLVAAQAAPLPERFYPADPPHGAVVGSRPVFELGYEGPEAENPRQLAFRITLNGEQRSYVFDQRRRQSGWLQGQPGRVLYRPRRPLADGSYRWRVWIWNGVEWKPGRGTFDIRIDSVPPADVERLGLRFDGDRRAVLLEWDPVSLDRNGRPEYVARYHVYRCPRGPGCAPIQAFEIGVVEQPRFVDLSPPLEDPALLYYRITAEDEAGNRIERPD